jgi:hypothetical protein
VLDEQPIEALGQQLISDPEGLRMRVADPLDDVPVAPARWNAPERRPGGRREQPAVRIERVEQAEEIVLVGPPTVVED